MKGRSALTTTAKPLRDPWLQCYSKVKEVNSKAGGHLYFCIKVGGRNIKVCVGGGGGGGGLSSTYVTCDYNSKWWVAHTLETHDDTK